ncbi:flagellar basal body-associated FliL family protein [Paracoccus bogoriensis]|uniref:flagellar basal body-associated FliL family protein n=1 Tax=Paracoccus bogoriensis TaxID=242065 RepID=UPI001FE8A0B8|nr:hypothetical protein [Paracoccus bogoriensis]
MIKKITFLVIPLLAMLGGAFAGDMLRPRPESDPMDDLPLKPAAPAAEPGWFTFPTQFFVPLVRQGDMSAIMVLTLVIETDATEVGALEHQEHRLRDALLRQLMIHANTGGFDGNYTLDRNLETLREGLLKAAQSATQTPIRAVLIQDLARQSG